LQRVNETLVRVQRTIAMLTLGVIVLSIVVTAFLVKVIVRPIQQLVAATRRIATGELGFTVAVTSQDELGDLAASFNRMAAVLRERESDNTRLVQALEETNRRLAAANRHKSAFLANMSHELRTPLNSIIGFSEVLLDETLGELAPEDQREFLGNILSSGRHLLTLINAVLDLSKVEAGHMQLSPAVCHVPEVISGVLNTIHPLAAHKHLGVEEAVDPALGTIVADVGKFKQILYNLLSNAVKFTPTGGTVAVALALSGTSVVLTVSDTGIGIRPEFKDQLFRRFAQDESSIAGAHGGLGLGLSIVRHLVELHHGTVRADSAGAGLGSSFIVELPLLDE
jgi:signal transduction histidine kinase